MIDLRYAAENNFVGQRVDGYRHAHAILSAPAVAALAKVQAALQPFGLGLKVFDAYRPQRAVDHFVRWGQDLDDRQTKQDYYPDVAKENSVYRRLYRQPLEPLTGEHDRCHHRVPRR